jgi:hypothetical protein
VLPKHSDAAPKANVTEFIGIEESDWIKNRVSSYGFKLFVKWFVKWFYFSVFSLSETARQILGDKWDQKSSAVGSITPCFH